MNDPSPVRRWRPPSPQGRGLEEKKKVTTLSLGERVIPQSGIG
jgi:hypothetical protein